MKLWCTFTIALFASLPSSTLAQQPSAPVTPPPQPLSLAAATTTALQQVSALQQAQIDEAIAAEDVRSAEAALLPRLRDSFSIAYNSPAHPPGSTTDPSFIAQNAVHEYQNLLGVAGDWNFGLIAAVRRSRALLQAARAGTEIARRAFVRGGRPFLGFRRYRPGRSCRSASGCWR